MKLWLKSFAVFLLYRLLQWSWRIEIHASDAFQQDLAERRPFIICLWHGNELGVLPISKHYKLSALVSKSKDGQMMTYVLGWMGVKLARGSSSKDGASGLLQLVRLIRKGYPCVFAVDGPKGPYRQVKPGLFEAAKLCQARIYPSGVAVSRYWMAKKSWNRAILPKPFAKIQLVWGEPMAAPDKKQMIRSLDLGREMLSRMHNAEQEAWARLAEL